MNSYNKGLWGTTRYGVGSFYFNTNVTVNVEALDIFVTVLEPTVYSFKEYDLDFVGTPTAGNSPLLVDFDAIMTIAGTSTLQVSAYNWFFDYGRDSNTFYRTTTNEILHYFDGYAGKKYSVKCITTFVDSVLSASEYKTDYITVCGPNDKFRIGTDRLIDIVSYLPEYLRSE